MTLHEGLVIRTHGGHYYVLHEGRELDCAVRGRLKRGPAESDLVALGDRVRYRLTSGDHGVIEEVLPRQRVLSRAAPPPRSFRSGPPRHYQPGQPIEQVIVANVEQVVVVFAILSPPLNPFLLDRYLVACEKAELPVVVVVNKIDLVSDEQELAVLAPYRQAGYRLLLVSALTGQGLDALYDLLHGRLSVLVGPSGAGKSTLLNALWPDLDLEVGPISEAHDRGRHTTVVARMLLPEPGTYVADTPGMRQFRLWDIEPEQLEAFFPEMRPYLNHCRFSACTHVHEPGCAVREAAEKGEIAPVRYASYVRMFEHGF